MAVVHVNDSNFEAEVLSCEKTVLLDFFAVWCGPCKMIAPTVEKISNERADLKVCKIDVDDAPGLAAKFGIQSIPTLVVMRGGKIVTSAVGARDEAGILALVDAK